MFQSEYTLDEHALEIILLAFGFLSLICLFAIVILTGANIRRASDAERGERVTAWGVRWNPENERGPQKPYSDESFIDAVRRRSADWATDIKEELSCLTERLVPKRMPDDPSPLDQVTGPLRRMSRQATGERRRSLLEANEERGASNVEDVPATASGREEGDTESRRRPTKTDIKDAADTCSPSSKDSPV